jgi:hypothetical protein
MLMFYNIRCNNHYIQDIVDLQCALIPIDCSEPALFGDGIIIPLADTIGTLLGLVDKVRLTKSV